MIQCDGCRIYHNKKTMQGTEEKEVDVGSVGGIEIKGEVNKIKKIRKVTEVRIVEVSQVKRRGKHSLVGNRIENNRW